MRISDWSSDVCSSDLSVTADTSWIFSGACATQPAFCAGKLTVQRALGNSHDALVVGNQRAHDGFLSPETGVWLTRWRCPQHQNQHSTDDIQVGRFGPVREGALIASKGHHRLLKKTRSEERRVGNRCVSRCRAGGKAE